MEFELDQGMEILAKTPGVLRSLLSGLSQPWLRSDEGPDTWSPFDVAGHLVHGEKTDWVPRIAIILAQGESVAFEPFDRFAQEEDSVGKTIDDLLNEFEKLSAANLTTLEGFQLTDQKLAWAQLLKLFTNYWLESISRLEQRLWQWLQNQISLLT